MYMKKRKQFLSIFLALAISVSGATGVVAAQEPAEEVSISANDVELQTVSANETDGPASDAGKHLQLDRTVVNMQRPITDQSFAVKTTEGVMSSNYGDHDYHRTSGNAGDIIYSYLEETEEGGFRRIEAVDGIVYIESYDKDFKLQSTKQIKYELKKFGGYFHGKDGRYLVFGQDNPSESNETEVVRVVKYDDNWNVLGRCSITSSIEYELFIAGSLRMTETAGYLYIHTSRTIYGSWDDAGKGRHHQVNLTYIIDESNMDLIKKDAGGSWVSHSMDQYILSDEDYVYRLDLGDAYPRSIVLDKRTAYKQAGDEQQYWKSGDYRYPLLGIVGGTGDNYTGVSIGGCELIGDTIVTVGKSIIQDETISHINDPRNLFVIFMKKSVDTARRLYWLTDYTEEGQSKVGNPYMIVTDDGFYLLWEEEKKDRDLTYKVTKLAKMKMDGTLEGRVHTFRARLSDCTPIITKENKLVWYTTFEKTYMMFYSFDLDRLDDYEFNGYVWADELTVKLSQDTYTQIKDDKHAQSYKPEVSVFYQGKELVEGKDYTYTYKDCYTPGTAYVQVTGHDYYRGYTEKTYTILPNEEEDPPYQESPWWGTATAPPGATKTPKPSQESKPQATSKPSSKPGSSQSSQKLQDPKKVTNVKVVNSTRRTLKVTWKKQQNISGYQIQYALNKKFTKGKKTVQASKYLSTKYIRSLKKKKTYYVRIRAYTKTDDGTTYGAWSKGKKIKVKK